MMLLLFIQTGCQHDEYSDYSTSKGSHSLVATIEGEATAADTRTAVDNSGRVTWIESDELGVFGTQTQNALFKSTGQGSSVTFTGSLDSKGEEAQWAYYPYDKEAILTGNTLIFELRDHYEYSGTSYAPMLARKSADDKFQFHHLCGLLKITLGGGIPTNADKLVISSVGDDAPSLAGQATVNDVTASDAVLSISDSDSKSVSYSLENVSATEEYQTIFVPMQIGHYPQLKVSFYLKENSTPLFTRTISNLNVRRAVMTSMPILNWRTGEQFVLNESTTVLTDVTEGTVEIDTTEPSALIYQNVTPSEIPSEGDVLWSRVTEEYPNGFLGKVSEVIQNADGSYTVKTEPAALSEVFDELYIDETVMLEPEGSAQTRSSEEMKVFGFDITTKRDVEIGGEDNLFFAKGTFESGQQLTATFIFNKQEHIERAALSLTMGSKIALTFGMGGTIASKEFTQDVMNLKFNSIPLAYGIIQVTPVIDLKVNAKANGQFENSMTFSSESKTFMGAEYKDGQWQAGKSTRNMAKNESPWNFSGLLSFSGQLSTGMEMECAFKLYNMDRMKVAVSPYLTFNLEGSIEVNEENSQSLTEILNTAHLETYFEVGGGITIDASLFSDYLQKSIKVEPKQFGRRELYLLPWFKNLIASVKEKENAKQQATITTEVKRELLSKDTQIAIEVKNNAGEVVKKSPSMEYAGSLENSVVDETEAMAPEAEPTPIEEIVEELVTEETYVATPVVQSPLLSEAVQLKDKSVSFGVEKSLREQLIQLYKDTDGDHWKHNDNWCSDKPLEQWYGIGIVGESEDGHYYIVDLRDNNLNGSAKLSHKSIRHTDFSNNDKLIHLDLSGCVNMLVVSVFEDENLLSIKINDCESLLEAYIQGNASLKQFICSNCSQIETIHIYPTIPEYVDMSNCPKADLAGACGLENTVHFDAAGCVNLSSLYNGRRIEYLDLSGCTKLMSGFGEFWNTMPNLKTLKIRDWTELVELGLHDGQTYALDTLDIAGCTKLEFIGILPFFENSSERTELKLKWLNVAGCSSLKRIDHDPETLEYLDISNSHYPHSPFVSKIINKINHLDYPYVERLHYLYAQNSEIDNITFGNDNVYVNVQGSTINTLSIYSRPPTLVMNEAKVKNLYIGGMLDQSFMNTIDYPEEIRSLGIEILGQSIDLSRYIHLDSLALVAPELKSLDLHYQNQSLRALTLECPSLESLRLTDCNKIKSLDCSNSQLSTLDISGCSGLTSINCSDNHLSNLNIGSCVLLEALRCSNNSISALNLSSCNQLAILSCEGNRLTQLDLNNCNQLAGLSCGNNNLTRLDLSNCTQLWNLECSGNNLSELELSNNTNLRTLYCASNRLSTLTVNADYLYYLDCSGDQIETINLQRVLRLKSLNCKGCKLNSLDISACNTNLSDLDISDTKNLTSLIWGEGNQFPSIVIYATGSKVACEIPWWLDKLNGYEQRYTYTYKYIQDQDGDYVRVVDSVEDKGYGWWFPGEPDKGEHAR